MEKEKKKKSFTVRRWSNSEIKFIQATINKKAAWVGSKINRTPKDVTNARYRLKTGELKVEEHRPDRRLRKTRKFNANPVSKTGKRLWSKEELQYLWDNHEDHSQVEIANALGRPVGSIGGMIHFLKKGTIKLDDPKRESRPLVLNAPKRKYKPKREYKKVSKFRIKKDSRITLPIEGTPYPERKGKAFVEQTQDGNHIQINIYLNK